MCLNIGGRYFFQILKWSGYFCNLFMVFLSPHLNSDRKASPYSFCRPPRSRRSFVLSSVFTLLDNSLPFRPEGSRLVVQLPLQDTTNPSFIFPTLCWWGWSSLHRSECRHALSHFDLYHLWSEPQTVSSGLLLVSVTSSQRWEWVTTLQVSYLNLQVSSKSQDAVERQVKLSQCSGQVIASIIDLVTCTHGADPYGCYRFLGP